jgi:hypothetical protein
MRASSRRDQRGHEEREPLPACLVPPRPPWIQEIHYMSSSLTSTQREAADERTTDVTTLEGKAQQTARPRAQVASRPRTSQKLVYAPGLPVTRRRKVNGQVLFLPASQRASSRPARWCWLADRSRMRATGSPSTDDANPRLFELLMLLNRSSTCHKPVSNYSKRQCATRGNARSITCTF